MYKTEIRPSQFNALLDRCKNLNFSKYLYKLTLTKCRAFKDQSITFDFPVTALIGPNGGGKTTILGASALIYNTIVPRQFFARNRQIDTDMRQWSISYDLIDRDRSRTDPIKRTASFSREKWHRDAVDRQVLFFGISRTLPAVERRDLSKFTNKNTIFEPDQIHVLDNQTASQIKKILGKDVSNYSIIQINSNGSISLLSGKTQSGASYSEFHFGAGESSIIKMILGIEKASNQSLILIEEIENGLHPLAVARLVDYLIEVAERKRIQVIFTTHSEYAISALPAKAVWAAIDGTAIQGKLDIQSLRALTGSVSSKLVIYTEDSFAKRWVEAMIRSDPSIAFDAIDVYPMGGDGTAVNANKYHNEDPSNHIPSLCIIDGDSMQCDSEEQKVYRLPGDAPELHIFDEIVDKIDTCSGLLSVRLMHRYQDADLIKRIILDISATNRDHHLIFSQIGEKAGYIDEGTVIEAFLSTWCENYPEEVNDTLQSIQNYLPKVTDNSNS